MQTAESGRDRILRQVAQAFGKHRRRNHGRASYSKTLRDLAVSALAEGIAPGKVAQVSGVSQQSLTNWRSTWPEPKAPRELQLVDNLPVSLSEAPRMKPPADSSPAYIRLRSGVTIEIPISALTASLLIVLSGGEQ